MPTTERRDGQNSEREPKRKKKKLKKWPFVLVIAGLLFFFAPTIVGSTPLFEKIIHWNFSRFDGEFKVESASLGWFSPVNLTGVSVTDSEGNSLVECNEVSTSNSLFRFLIASDFGDIRLGNPTFHVHCRNDGSNLEDALAQMFPEDESDTDTQIPIMNLSVTDGRIVVSSDGPDQQHAVDIKTAEIQFGGESAPLDGTLDCTVVDAFGKSGQMQIRAIIDEGQSELISETFAINVETHQLPIAVAGPILERFIGPCQMDGILNGQLSIAARASLGAASVSTEGASLTNVAFRAPKVIANDQLIASAINLTGKALISPDGIAADQLKLTSEHGTVNANGKFDFGQLANMANNVQFVHEPFQLDGQLNLARLAPMFNSTLSLHQDLQIESGMIQFQVNSRQENNLDRLVVNLDVANLQATRGQQKLVWQKPLRIAGRLHQQDGMITISDAECTSDFLTLRGDGTIQKGEVEIEGDLQLMANRIGQFVDLNGMKLAGLLDGKVAWDADTTNSSIVQKPIQLGGEFTIQQPFVQWPTTQAWQPNQLTLQLRGTGKTDGQQVSIEQGGMQIDVGSEKIIAVLNQPVANLWQTPSWQLNCQATGRIGEWLAHVSNFADLGTLRNGDGQLDLNCLATIDSKSIRLDQISYRANQFSFDGYGLLIREPAVNGNGNLTYDLGSGWTSIDNLTASTDEVIIKGQKLHVLFADKMMVDGNVNFRAGVNRIANWYGFSRTPDSILWSGSADGTIAIQSDESGIHGQLKSAVQNLVAAKRASIPNQSTPMQMVSQQQKMSELWREAAIQIDGKLTLGHDFDSITFTDLTAIGNSVAIATTGKITDLANQWNTRATGQWNPNWQMVNSMAQKYAGEKVSLSGREVQTFSIDGPLFELVTASNPVPSFIPAGLRASTSIELEQGNLFHLPLGRSSIGIELIDGVAVINASDLQFAQGVANLAPRIDSRSETPTLVLGSAKILDRVELNGETCQKWLKYVAPLLADATAAQGKFSLTSEGTKIPLNDPTKMSARGTIELIDASVSAGPLSQQLIGTANQIKSILKRSPNAVVASTDKPWIQLSQQSVPFAVQEGRVYHEGLSFTHKDITFKTTGSVGFDQTLYVVAQIPIADQWIAGDKWLAGLKGQFLSIPISGTVTRPVLDRRALQQLSQQLIQSGAQSAINNVIGDKLNDQVDQFKSKLGGQLEDKLKGGLENLFKKKD